jgi:ankyrin repeat protein
MDKHMNSVRGKEFLKRLTHELNYCSQQVKYGLLESTLSQ